MTEIIATAGLALNVVVAVIGLTWGLGKVKDAIHEEIEKHRIKFDDELSATERNMGQGLVAIREKIREVELFCRDTYIRRDSFSEVMSRIEKRLERMEEKIDDAKNVAAALAKNINGK